MKLDNNMENPWDKIASKRNQSLLDNDDIVFSNILLPQIKEFLNRHKKTKSLHVLDIGCGTGVLTKEISFIVNSIVGVDPSSNSINEAKKNTRNISNIHFECIDIEDFALHNNKTFDYAIAHMTLHAIENLELALSSIAKLLKQSGYFLLTLPHPVHWASIFPKTFDDNYDYKKISTHSNEFYGTQTPHYHRPVEFYEAALKEAGFLIEETLEPTSPRGLMEQHGKREWKYPGFLFYLCRQLIED